MQSTIKQKIDLEKSSRQTLDEYFDKILFYGKIKNTEYIKTRKQEFPSAQFVQENKDIIILNIVMVYFNKRIRAYFNKKIDSRDFDANKLSDREKERIICIRDYLYHVVKEYVNDQIVKATNTKHKPIIRFDYLKSCNEYDDLKQTFKLAKQWHRAEVKRHKKDDNILRQSEKGTYKIMDLDNGYSVVQLFSTKALDYEGRWLKHCVGDGFYDDRVHKQGVEIYSIRNKRGRPFVTLEVNDGKIVQCKGYKNTTPCNPELRKAVRALMYEQNLDLPDVNTWNKLIAYIKVGGFLYDVFELPENFVSYGTINLSAMDLTELPDMSTVTTKGDFWCPTNKLTNLQGAPHTVTGDCKVSKNPLVSLYGMPRNIGGKIYLSDTSLNTKSFVPLYMENKLNDIIGVDDKIISAWKEQIHQRKAGLQNIMMDLLNNKTI